MTNTLENNTIQLNYTQEQFGELKKPIEQTIDIQEIEILKKKTITFEYNQEALQTLKTKKIGIYISQFNGHKIEINNSNIFHIDNPTVNIDIYSCLFSDKNNVVFYLGEVQRERLKNVFMKIKIIFETKQSSTTISEENREKYLIEDKEFFSEGGEAFIYNGKYFEEDVVIKKFRMEGKGDFEREIFDHWRHPNIIDYFGYYMENSHLCIVMKKAMGCLHYHLNEYSECEYIDILKGVLKGIGYLHGCGIAHLDISMKNILLCRNNNNGIEAKLTDFGFSMKIGKDEVIKKDESYGTPYFMDPQIIMNQEYSQKSDIFSFGRLVEILLSGKKLSVIENENKQIDLAMSKNEYDPENFYEIEREDKLNKKAQEMIMKCCAIEREERCDNIEELNDMFDVMKIYIKTQECGLKIMNYKVSLGDISLEHTLEIIIQYCNNTSHFTDVCLEYKIRKNEIERQLNQMKTQLNEGKITEKEYNKEKDKYMKKQCQILQDLYSSIQTKMRHIHGGDYDYSEGTLYEMIGDPYYKNEIINCYKKAFEKGNVDAYDKLMDEFKRIKKGLEDGTIVEELQTKHYLNMLVDLLQNYNPLLNEIQRIETEGKEEITEHYIYDLLSVLSKSHQTINSFKLRWLTEGKGVRMNVEEAVRENEQIFVVYQSKHLKNTQNILNLLDPTIDQHQLWKDLYNSDENEMASNAMILSYSERISKEEESLKKANKEKLETPIAKLNEAIYQLNQYNLIFKQIKTIIELAEQGLSQAIETIIELIEQKDIVTWKHIQQQFMMVKKNKYQLNMITPSRLYMYYLIKGSYLLNKTCLNKLAQTIYDKSTSKNTVILRLALNILHNEIFLEKKQSLVIGAKILIKLNEKMKALQLFTLLNEQFYVEGTNMLFDLTKEEIHNDYEIYRKKQKQAINQMKKVDKEIGMEMEQKANKVVIEQLTIDLLKRKEELEGIVQNQLKIENPTSNEIYKKVEKLANDESSLLALIHNKSNSSSKLKKEVILIYEYSLLHLSFEDKKIVNPIPLFCYGYFLYYKDRSKETNLEANSNYAACAVNISSKMGLQSAFNLGKTLAYDRKFRNILERQNSSQDNGKKSSKKSSVIDSFL